MGCIKLGILGTADVIGRSLIEPSKKVERLNIYAIASRSEEKAKSIAEKYSIPNYFSGYDTLLNNKEIDAVYIPLINSLHADWTIKAIKAGKHVLIEKPLCLNSEDLKRIKECLDDHPEVVVLEGLMSQHHPFSDKLLEIIKNKKYGALKSLKTKASYNINEPNDFRLFPEKGGSVFFEEGLLWCHLTQICLGLEPLDFDTQCDFNGPNGGDHIFQTKLTFQNGVTSELFCSYAHPYQADHFINFEKAEIKIKNFWRPTFGFQKLKMEINNFNSVENEDYVFESQNYFFNQLNFFIDVIEKKKKNIPIHESFERIELMEKIYNKAKIHTTSC